MMATVLLLTACVSLGGAVCFRPQRRQRIALLSAFVVLAATGAVVAGTYELRKLAGACLLPAGLLWFALLAVAGWCTGSQRSVAVALWLLWIGYGLAGNGLVGDLLIGWLERDYAAIDPMQQEPFDAILVLGGGVGQARHGQLALGCSGDRLMLAARLFHAGKVRLLITTGPTARHGLQTMSYPAMAARVWQDLGVPAGQILQVAGPRTTSEEIARLAELLQEHRWQRIGLLTSASHLRRAMKLCRRHRLTVHPLPAGLRRRSSPLQPRHLMPQGSGFHRVHIACWELLGAAVGR